ncbi:MAG: class I SAM-dependent methyltransferase, partial [Kovacikia sp.]
AYKDDKFKVWRCPHCQTIHCLDIVDLDFYYAKYHTAGAALTWAHRFIYDCLCRQLTKHGFSKTHSLLDYGCGANGLFVRHLQQRGFTHSYGYDPYGPSDGFGNPTILQRAPFDYISLQEVIEHVEDPRPVLSQLNSLLSPKGYILISTPNAANLNLKRPDLPDNAGCIHVPYHLHIYTRETLESLGRSQGWEPVAFFDRKYDDTSWFGFNSRAACEYACLIDGSMDVFNEPLKLWKMFSSPKFLFWATFGYWLSSRPVMSIMFRKNL